MAVVKLQERIMQSSIQKKGTFEISKPKHFSALVSAVRLHWVVLSLIVGMAIAFRFIGLDWDNGGIFHPDERAILVRTIDCIGSAQRSACGGDISEDVSFSSFFSADRSPLNPRWFNYGSLPLYLLKISQIVTGNGYPDLRIPGRLISAAADIVTVLLVYALGTRLFSRRVGLLASALVAMAVLHIQLSHFLTVDSILTALVVASVYFSVRVAQNGGKRDSLFAGVAFGLALATKFAALPLGLAVLVAHVGLHLSSKGEGLSGVEKRRSWYASKGVLLAGAGALVAFFVGQPYAILDWQNFISDVSEQSAMVRFVSDLPFTRQYIDTPSYAYQILQVGTWGLGPALGITAWLGLCGGVVLTAIRRRKAEIVVMSWVLIYFAITGSFGVKFMRYMEPLTPFMIIYGAAGILWLTDKLRGKIGGRKGLFAWTLPAVLLLLTLHYAISFMNVYTGEHPALRASAWLENNAPSGSKITKEHWEEAIPLKSSRVRYVSSELPLYDLDTSWKFEEIFDSLSKADYLVLYSNRLYGTIPRLPERYPISAEYYEALFSGELGYEVVFNDTRSISGLGVLYYEDPFVRVPLEPPEGFEVPRGRFMTISMGWADESFSVYDHPHVIILQNKGRLQPAEMMEVIDTEREAFAEINSSGSALLLDREQTLAHRSGGTWVDVAFLRFIPWWLAWLPWLLAIYAVWLAVMPFAFTMFRAMPDKGWLWARPLGLLCVSWVTWIIVSLGVAEFGILSVVAGLILVMSASFVWGFRIRRDLLAFVRLRWRRVVFFEVLFLSAFVAFLFIRMSNPDLWHTWRGGEKPLDFAYLNAVTRSSVIPPYDPWFSGGYLNYYYYGQFMFAWLIRLTGIESSIAYNLAIPTVFAFTVGGAFSLGYGLAWTILRAIGRGFALGGKGLIMVGLFSVLLIAIAGNVDGFVQAVGILFGNIGTGFDYWRSSRLISLNPPSYEITEFPFFSFLYGDLHAHMIAIPFAILATGLAIGVYASYTTGRSWWRLLPMLAVLGLAIGALRALNTWDFPVQAALAVTITGIAVLLQRDKTLIRRVFIACLWAGVIIGVGYLAFIPFNTRFQVFNAGIVPSVARTPLWQYWIIHMPFLAAILSWLAVQLYSIMREKGRVLVSIPVVAVIAGVVAVAIAAPSWGTFAFVLAVAAGLIAVGVYAIARKHRQGNAVVLPIILALCGLGLGALVELVNVQGDIGRQNTVFKFYIQAWWIMAAAAAVFVWLLWQDPLRTYGNRFRSGFRIFWRVGVVAMILVVLVYPAMAIPARLKERFDTSFVSLDGAAFMERSQAAEIPYWCFGDVEQKRLDLSADFLIIKWLQTNVEGSPVIVEGLMAEYCWGNRIAVYTGLPSVIGWGWHQTQQRWGYQTEVRERRADVERFYRTTSPEEAADFLNEYDVRYIVVGELEQVIYPSEGLQKFENMVSEGDLRRIYTDATSVIYERSAESSGGSYSGIIKP